MCLANARPGVQTLVLRERDRERERERERESEREREREREGYAKMNKLDLCIST
jgi:hypothetical protein